MSVDFTGYEEIEVLQALVDNAVTSDFYLKFGQLDAEVAQSLIERSYIEYINGRYLGVSFANFPIIASARYDELNGDGAMQKVLKLLYDRTVF